MAREIKQIYTEMLVTKNADSRLSSLTNTSETAIWKLIFMVCATAIWAHEKLFDKHLQDVENLLSTKKPHSLSWYYAKVMDFQLAGNFNEDTGAYDNTGLTDAEVQAQKIVAHCAVIERGDSAVVIKVAKLSNSSLTKLLDSEKAALQSYMQKQKDAGVMLVVQSLFADNLKLNIDVYVDPMIIQTNGYAVGSSSIKPVENAIIQHLKSLPFNSEFSKMGLVDVVQKVSGVKLCDVVTASAKAAAETAYTTISSRYSSQAGYMQFSNPSDLEIYYHTYANQL